MPGDPWRTIPNDAFGHRVARSTVDCPAATGCGSEVLQSVYIWDGPLRIIGELRYPSGVSSVPVRYRYVYATHANVPDYVMQDGNVKYRLVHDHLGSLRFAYDATTAGTEGRHLSRRYDVLGAVVSEVVSGVDLPFGFAGGLFDREAGFVDDAGAPVLVHGRSAALVRFGARDYEPFAGRWMAPDPIHFNGSDSNLYGYCGGDPLNRIDPYGLFPGEGYLARAFTDRHGHRVNVFANSFYARGAAARTIGHSVYVADGVPIDAVLTHELAHVEQFDRMYQSYLLYTVGNLAAMTASTAASGAMCFYSAGVSSNTFDRWGSQGHGDHWYHAYSRFNPFEWGPYMPTPEPWGSPWR